MKLLSYQPSELYRNGGAPRLLRRLYEGHEKDVTALFPHDSAQEPKSGLVKQIPVLPTPLRRSWMRWKIRNFVMWLQDSFFFNRTKNDIIKAAKAQSFDCLHIVNHGVYSAVLCNDEFLQNKQLWVSFHDHFSLCSSFEDTKKLWLRADRRLVISNELGEEYSKVFGHKDFEMITDGVSESEISTPADLNNNGEISLYFSGLLHIDYYPLFSILADALDILSSEKKIVLILRGTQKIDFLNNRKFETEYRTNYISDDEIKQEMDSADILYLPIKFSLPAFYLYSLSTKMISYLGAAGKILFHGPKDSAANILLEKHNAAVSCVSLEVTDMTSSLKEILNTNSLISKNAKELAANQFKLKDMQARFWNK
jgi:hypothetical protein